MVLIPVSYAGYFILKILGIPITYSGPNGILGYCEYHLSNAVLEITFGCTGIFALFILLSGIIAYPASLKLKGAGFFIAVVLFYIYSVLRLIIISLFGYIYPESLSFIHSYLMEVCNIGFILFVYIIWIRYVEKTGETI